MAGLLNTNLPHAALSTAPTQGRGYLSKVQFNSVTTLYTCRPIQVVVNNLIDIHRQDWTKCISICDM